MLAALLLALSLSAPPTPVSRAQAGTAFDGTWTGTGTLVERRGRGSSCGPETTNRRFTIANGQISWAYDNRYGIGFSGPIQADGSFDLASGPHRLQGQANGSTMTATYIGTECVRSFRMRRRRD
jgi:hypothetical protein